MLFYLVFLVLLIFGDGLEEYSFAKLVDYNGTSKTFHDAKDYCISQGRRLIKYDDLYIKVSLQRLNKFISYWIDAEIKWVHMDGSDVMTEFWDDGEEGNEPCLEMNTINNVPQKGSCSKSNSAVCFWENYFKKTIFIPGLKLNFNDAKNYCYAKKMVQIKTLPITLKTYLQYKLDDYWVDELDNKDNRGILPLWDYKSDKKQSDCYMILENKQNNVDCSKLSNVVCQKGADFDKFVLIDKKPMNYSDALGHCLQNGMKLIKATSMDVMIYLEDKTQDYWIDLHAKIDEYGLQYADNTTVKIRNWASGEPNLNVCAMVHLPGNKWKLKPCNSLASAVCFNESYFDKIIFIPKVKRKFKKALKYCKDIKMKMIRAESEALMYYLQSKTNNYWSELKKVRYKNLWFHIDGSQTSKTFWNKNERGSHRCVTVKVKNNKWKTFNCSRKASVICYKSYYTMSNKQLYKDSLDSCAHFGDRIPMINVYDNINSISLPFQYSNPTYNFWVEFPTNYSTKPRASTSCNFDNILPDTNLSSNNERYCVGLKDRKSAFYCKCNATLYVVCEVLIN